MNVRSSDTSLKTLLWKTIILALAFIVNATLALRLVWGPQSFVTYRELKGQYESLSHEVQRFDTINATLSREIRLLQSDDRYMEKVIRQRLNFVRDNEILYLFTEGQGSGAGSDDGKN